jgi:4-amino-4-deoxy-L-arabinose transferase-like glycosyltransferase
MAKEIGAGVKPYLPWAYAVLFLGAALLSGLHTVFPESQAGEHWIGRADRAWVADLARNIAEGRGPYVNHVWLLVNGGMPGNELPAPAAYWSLYHGYLLSLGFRLSGPSKEAVMLTAWLLRVVIALAAAGLTRRLVGRSFLAFTVSMVLLLHPHMISVTNGNFDIYLTASLTLGLSALLLGLRTGSRVALVLSGLGMAVAIGLKVSGLVLLLSYCCYLIVYPDRQRHLRQAAFVAVGICIGLAPMVHYNWKHFDNLSPLPPGLSIVREAQFRRSDASHNSAFYDPTLRQGPPTHAPRQQVSLMVENYRSFIGPLAKGQIIPAWLAPFALVAFIDLLGQAWRRKRMPDGPVSVMVFFALMYTLAGFSLPALIHGEPRYWNFLFPVLLVAASTTFASRRFPTLLAAAALLTLVGTVGAHEKQFYYSQLPHGYRAARVLLPEGAVVMTNNPWEFAFHTRRPSVMLPFTDQDDAVVALARRFGVEYLVVIDRDNRHPHFNPIRDGTRFPDYLERVHWEKNLAIGRFVGGADADPAP